MHRALRLEDIKTSLDPRPLSEDQLDQFFVETSEGRDHLMPQREEIAMLLEGEGDTKVLLVGHAGSGKSTELVKLQEENATSFAYVSFSLTDEGSPGSMTIEALLLLIVEAVLRAADAQGLSLDPKTLKLIHDWFAETFEIKENDLVYTGSVGAGADTKDSFFGKLLGLSAYLKADIKTGSSVLHKSITKDNKRLSQLAFQCAELLREAHLAFRQKGGPSEMLLVLEDMDKVSVAEADELFLRHGGILAALPTKAIFTAPIFLLCNPQAAILDAYFEKVTLPMIKVENREGDRCDEGYDSVRRILSQRIDLETLVDEDALELAIEKTGGVLRHLFEALQRASLTASSAVRHGRRDAPAKLTKADVRYGLNRLKADLVRRIGVLGLPKEFEDITTEDLYERLEDLAKTPRKAVSDKRNLLLLQAHALLEYNGEGWHRVHPLVKEFVEARQGP